MLRPLFGQLLGKIVNLSDHDIAEILEDQAISHRRFGDIAMAFQLCRPQDVWQAWWAQLGSESQTITLPLVGVDTQTLSWLPREIAEEYTIMPLRGHGDQLVVAATDQSRPRASAELPALLNKEIRFVIATEDQIRDAIANYYLREAV